jgi:hypothetical protein
MLRHAHIFALHGTIVLYANMGLASSHKRGDDLRIHGKGFVCKMCRVDCQANNTAVSMPRVKVRLANDSEHIQQK